VTDYGTAFANLSPKWRMTQMLQFNFKKTSALLMMGVSTLAISLGACSSSQKKHQVPESPEMEAPQAADRAEAEMDAGELASEPITSDEMDSGEIALEENSSDEIPVGEMARLEPAPATGSAPSSTTLDQDLALVTRQQAGRAAQTSKGKKTSCSCECPQSETHSGEEAPGQASESEDSVEYENSTEENSVSE
jgi:hypothetical protein